jgi:hypothetical protein
MDFIDDENKSGYMVAFLSAHRLLELVAVDTTREILTHQVGLDFGEGRDYDTFSGHSGRIRLERGQSFSFFFFFLSCEKSSSIYPSSCLLLSVRGWQDV